MKVLIYGAGSIGNHMAHACKSNNCNVTICDVSKDALMRTKNEIYPSRYEKWDETIQLCLPNEVETEKYDTIIIGTPPDTHISVAMYAIKHHQPKTVLIEKPLATPTLHQLHDLMQCAKNYNVDILVGYNHVLTKNTKYTEELLSKNTIGKPLNITAAFKEHWGGIFKAHPWLNGPEDTYLGFSARGGGATGEHSHAINIWQHFTHVLDMGRVIEVTAFMDMVETEKYAYDRYSHICVKTENGLQGTITQDVITEPVKKFAWIQGDLGMIEWNVNAKPGFDSVVTKYGSNQHEELFAKTRPDDFQGEIQHLMDVCSGKIKLSESPISLQRGIDTMLIIAAAYKSHQEGRKIKIDYGLFNEEVAMSENAALVECLL